ncbi:hypothetical protein ACIQCD_21140 [Streptomyces sp. NPDC093250]
MPIQLGQAARADAGGAHRSKPDPGQHQDRTGRHAEHRSHQRPSAP